MSNNALIADELFDQLQRSNRLYALAYAKGYEDGIKYACDKLEKLTKDYKPMDKAWNAVQ